MSALTATLLYIGALVFVVGTGLKIFAYMRAPAPLKMPLQPAPQTRPGVALRLLRETVFFESLWKASRWTWLCGWLFHAALLFVLLTHLRYFTQPVWAWVAFIAPLGRYAGLLMMMGLGGLLIRRIAVARVRFISAPSDYLMLLLLLAIAASGLAMRYIVHTDIVQLKLFALALLRFEIVAWPGGILLFVHLLLVVLLLLVFPFSKLLHAPGLYFSPARYQVDNSRERRHLSRLATPPVKDGR